MEGGNKNKISLESGLDIKTSDMMSPVSAPKFQHNRQQYQGHYLPTSLRFEHDGWAADWDVYQFDIATASLSTSPAEFAVVKYLVNNNPSYMLVFQKDTGLAQRIEYAKLWWDYETSTSTPGVSASRTGMVSSFTGQVDGKTYTVTINPVTKQYLVSAGFDLTVVIGSDGKYNVEVIDTTKTVSFSVLLKPATNMVNTDNNGKFADIASFKDNKYTWDGKAYGEFTHTLGTSQVYSVNDDKSFAANIVNGVLTAVYEYIFTTKYNVKFTNEKFIPMIYNMAAVPLSAEQGFVMNAANVFGKDSPDCMYAKVNTTELMDGSPVIVWGYLPLWAGISIGFNYDLTGDMLDELLFSDITKSGYKIKSKAVADETDFVIYDKPVRVWSGGAFDHLEKINATVVGTDMFVISAQFDMLVSKVPGSAWKPKTKEYFPDTKYLPNSGSYSAGYYLHGLYKFGEDELHELAEGFYYNDSYWMQEDEPVKKRQQQRIKIQKKHRKQAVDDEGNPLYLDDEGNETTEVTDTPIYETNPDGSAVYEYEFDSDGNPVYETDENGDYVYETNPDGSLKYEYNPDGTPKYELEEDGKYVYEYDDEGNVKFELDANGLPVTGPAIDDYGNPVYVPGNLDETEIISFKDVISILGNTVNYSTGTKWSVTGTSNTRDYTDRLSYNVEDDNGDAVEQKRIHINSVKMVVTGTSSGAIVVNNYMFNNVSLTLSYNMRTDSMEASGPFGPISWVITQSNYINSLKAAYSPINYVMTYTNTRFAIAHTYPGYFQYAVVMTDPVRTDNYSEKFSVVQSVNAVLIDANHRYIDRDIGGVNSKHMIDIDHVTTYLAGNDFYVELAVKSASDDTKFFSSNNGDDFTVGTAMPDYIYYADMDRVSGGDRGYAAFNPGTNNDEYTTRFRVSGTAANVVYLTDASGLFDTQYDGTGHAFFDTTYKQWITTNGTAVTPLQGTLTKYPLIGPVYNGTQQIMISINGVIVSATFTTTFTPIPAPENVTLVTFNTNTTNINGYNVSFSVETSTQDALDVVLSVPLRFNLRAELASATNGSSVVSFDGNKYTMSYGGTQYTMDLDNLSTDYLGKKFVIDEVTSGYYSEISYRASADFTCTVKGPYKEQNITVVSFTDTVLTVLIDGKQYTLDISNKGLFNDELKSLMTFKYTDTREKELTENIIAEIDPNNEFQFVKQQWDTTNDTENFWWVDSDHILVLTKTRLIVRRKTDDIDDWDGDVWEDEALFLRSQFIDNTVIKYNATCAYGGDSALFWMIKQADSTKFTVEFYDPLQGMDLVRTMTFNITKRSIGSKLVANAAAQTELYTYSDIQLSNMLSFSRFSATCRDGYIIFGIHYDNNYNQWVGVIGRNTGAQRTIQGYGFVGADGSLTGGEIPSDYYDSKIGGFTGTVDPVSILNADKKDITSKVSDIYKIDVGNRIVGNDSQQWYISTEIKSIVSHLTYNGGGNFKESHLYIHNNLSQIYSSGSYALRTWSDIMPWVTGLKSILPDNIDTDSTGGQAFNTIFTVVMAAGGWPSVYGISPKFNTIAYLQQTLGQYAYVHYNSTSKPDSDITEKSDSADKAGMTTRGNLQANKDYEENDDALETDEMSFNVHAVPQSASFNKPWTGLLALCLQMYLSVSEFDPSEATVNNLQNQSAVNDKGNKYSAMFRKNMEGLASTVNLIKGAVPTTKSVIMGMLSLDMFYSTSDSQKVYAGPGYVNHNFVAQCIAQSATTNIVELNQVGMQYIISAFTLFQLEITVQTEEFAADLLEKTADMTKEMTVSIFGNSVNIGAAIAIGLVAAANVIRIAVKLQKIFLKYMPGILAGLGADQLHPGIINSVRNKDYDFEAKHRYGTKSECFMWPCFGVESAQEIDDEYAEAVTENNPWPLKMPISSKYSNLDNILTVQPINQNTEFTGIVTNNFVNINSASDKTVRFWNDAIPFYSASVKGVSEKIKLPENMAYVIGAESFLSKTAFRNENIGEGDPTFTTPPFQDYVIDKDWQLGHTATYGDTVWVSCKDTKLFDGAMSNAVISDDFCGVSCPYTAIEIKKGITRRYMRPWAITPSSLLLNNSGLNCCFEHKAYHAADGFGYRIVNWLGAPGINKNKQTLMYSFLVNDRFKRSNKMPPNEFLGNFTSDPVVATFGDSNDAVWTLTAQYTEGKGIAAGTKGEDKDSLRYSVPIFSEFVSTLPAVVKTVAAYNLDVIEGITTLTSDNRDMTTNYKAPVSVDFAIGKNMYRYTQEYICSLTQTQGIAIVENLVPCLGLTFIGSTPYEAYLYSQATRQYYSFSGGSSLQLVDMIERFRNVINGRYDFVNQEVLMPCLATFVRLDKKVQDDENEVDNIMIPRLKSGSFIGEVWPPIETIFNTRSWFRTLSMPMGIVYQGPNRCIVNRFVYSDYMLDQIKSNYGLWERVPREEYHPFRKYRAEYEQVDEDIGDTVLVKGWTHNPFLLVTAPLGVSDEIDCMFEWEITFCWPVEMDKLYDNDNYATVNIWAETMTPGGKVLPERPTHVYLTKELFTRTGNYGYYSFRYQSKCGAGNRERLHIWSDQYICVSALQCEYKEITSKRTEILTQQADVQLLNEI